MTGSDETLSAPSEQTAPTAADASDLKHPRANPAEWHRRGLRAPAELTSIINARLYGSPAAEPVEGETAAEPSTLADPTYGDFLGEPTA